MANGIIMLDLDKTIQRFQSLVHKSDSGCFEWSGAKQANGYGRFRAFGKSMYAHRFSALLKFGIVRSDLDVCHSCDNRNCVNPEHLFIGTRKENMEDCVSKGRQAKGDKLSGFRCGESSPFAKLNAAQALMVRSMKSAGIKTRAIAAEFNITTDNVRRIVRRDTWKEI
jgi:hypothetical protein